MSGRLPRPSSPAPPSLCPCCRSRKMWKYPRYCFSSNGILISTVPHPQSSVVAFIPSPPLSACCLLNLSSQGDHLDFSRFFLQYFYHISTILHLTPFLFIYSKDRFCNFLAFWPVLSVSLSHPHSSVSRKVFHSQRVVSNETLLTGRHKNTFFLFWTFVVPLVLTCPTCLGPIPLCH